MGKITVTVSNVNLDKDVIIDVPSLAQAAAPAPATSVNVNYTDEQLVQLLIGDDKDSVHIAGAMQTINKWKKGYVSTPVATTPTATTTTPTTTPTTPSSTTLDLSNPNWLGEWSGNVKDFVASKIKEANGKVVTLFVPYNIPGRDNGNYSKGGLHSASEYAAWTDAIAQGIGSASVIVVLEPDALGLAVALNETQRQERYTMLNNAVAVYKKLAKTKVYIDSSMWLGVDKSAEMLKPIKGVDGFSCNVSGYQAQADCVAYGIGVFKKTGLRFVIDTSRNGNGAPHGNMWCNQTDTKVGIKPTTDTKVEGCDAFLWVKVPGESDGLGINDDGSRPRTDVPAAGTMWPEFRDAIYSGDWTAFKKKYNV